MWIKWWIWTTQQDGIQNKQKWKKERGRKHIEISEEFNNKMKSIEFENQHKTYWTLRYVVTQIGLNDLSCVSYVDLLVRSLSYFIFFNIKIVPKIASSFRLHHRFSFTNTLPLSTHLFIAVVCVCVCALIDAFSKYAFRGRCLLFIKQRKASITLNEQFTMDWCGVF